MSIRYEIGRNNEQSRRSCATGLATALGNGRDCSRFNCRMFMRFLRQITEYRTRCLAIGNSNIIISSSNIIISNVARQGSCKSSRTFSSHSYTQSYRKLSHSTYKFVVICIANVRRLIPYIYIKIYYNRRIQTSSNFT